MPTASLSPVIRSSGQIWGSRSRFCQIGAVRFGFYEAEDIEIEPHVHEDAHLVFVLEGQYVTSADGAPPVCAAPVLVDNPAGTAHRDHFAQSTGKFLTINIAPERSREGRAVISRAASDIARMFEVVAELDFARPTLLLEEVAETALSRDEAEPSGGVPGWAGRAYDMLREEAPGSVCLSRLASEADVHPVHMARVFRRLFGRTAGQLQRDFQYEQARRDLVQSDKRIVDIALDLGFYDQAHFTRFMTARSGVSPKNLRQRRAEV